MFRNFIITTVRIAYKQKLNTILNILGLAIAIAVSVVLTMHIKHELSFDKHIPDHERIFRVASENLGDGGRKWATTSTPLFYELKDFFPEIEQTLRVFNVGSSIVLGCIMENDETREFEEFGGFYVDSTVFEFFSLEFLKGSAETALSDFNAIVLTESLAMKYFGKIDVVNMQMYAGNPQNILTVSAVIKDSPKTTHWKYNYLLPVKRNERNWVSAGYSDLFYSRGWAGCYNYIKLKENTNPEAVKDRLTEFRCHYLSEAWDMSCEELEEQGAFRLQALTDIHLKSNLEEEITINGNYTYVIVFILSTIFILIVASVNYINIAISLSLKRMKEIGIKKINGSNQYKLRLQFVGEALLTTILSAIIAILLIDLILPLYNNFSGQEFVLSNLFRDYNFTYFVIIILLIGFLSGLYPAFFITRFNTIDSLKGLKDPSNKSNRLRKVLLIFQFVVSIFMVFVTIGIYSQMSYLKQTNMGFDKESLVYIENNGALRGYILNNQDAFKNELIKLPFIQNVCYSSDLPGERYSVEGLMFEGRDPDAPNGSVRFIRVGKDYIKTMGLQIVDGTDFIIDNPQHSRFIISEATVEMLQLKEPIGMKTSSMFGGEGEIVGVLEDHHFASLHMPIEPLALEYNMGELKSWCTNYSLIKLSPGNINEQITNLKEAILNLEPDAIINIGFVVDYVNALYVTETKMGNLFKGFTAFTIFIACLGLFGITAYNAELKTKEVGVRKALGASRSSIINLLSIKFLYFILFAIIIAIPLGYFYVHKWLNNFAYHTNISIWSIVLTIVIGVLIAYLTIIYHAFRISSRKTTDILKYE